MIYVDDGLLGGTGVGIHLRFGCCEIVIVQDHVTSFTAYRLFHDAYHRGLTVTKLEFCLLMQRPWRNHIECNIKEPMQRSCFQSIKDTGRHDNRQYNVHVKSQWACGPLCILLLTPSYILKPMWCFLFIEVLQINKI